MSRPLVALFALVFFLPLRSGAQEKADADPDGKWRGKLYCLALWAQRANPEQPKDLAEAFLHANPLHPRGLPGMVAGDFPLDSDLEEARRWFSHGLACLHLLWDEEAERAFRYVLLLEPDCAMACWGLAMANFDRPGRGAFFARLATGKIKAGTPKDVREWIAPVARFFEKQGEPLPPRLARLGGDLEELAMASPGSTEAKALLLRQLVLNDLRGGLEVRSPWAVDRLATEVLESQPSHPARQSRLLLWTRHKPEFLAEAGLLDPASLPEGAPAQAWRILAEAQQAAGRWEASVAALVRALEIELAARVDWFERPVRGVSFEEDGAALVSALGRLGRTEEAFEVAEALKSLPLPGQAAIETGDGAFWRSAYGQALRSTASLCQEHRLFGSLATLGKDALAVSGDLPSNPGLRDEIVSLVTPVTAARKEVGPVILAHRQLAEGEPGSALQTLEMLGSAERRPFLPRALSILAHHRAKDPKQALFLFDELFRRQAGAADTPVRDDATLREVAALRRLPADWALPPAADEAATVKALAAQLRSAAPSAPEFSLPDGRDARVDLASFRGRPVVLIFFLGAGCFQCVEQLHAFLPEADAYAEAGIPIVCVSTDPVSVLKFTIRQEKLGTKPIPFTILSDDQLAVFKRYHVYNEFERRPLHGTFLLDGEGRVRWSFVDNQPFMKPRWLLKEARRVLPE